MLEKKSFNFSPLSFDNYLNRNRLAQKKTAGLLFNLKMQPGCLLEVGGKTRGFPAPSFNGSGFLSKYVDLCGLQHVTS